MSRSVAQDAPTFHRPRDGHPALAAFILALLLTVPGVAQVLTLSPDPPGPQPAGTPITWTATMKTVGTYVYRFTQSFNSGPERVLRDFSTLAEFQWAPITPGDYVVSVHVRRPGDTTELQTAREDFRVTNPAMGSTASVRLTGHPLVAVYSAPPCADDAGQLALEVRRPSDPWQRRIVKPCRAPGGPSASGVCFWVAGLRPETTYLVRHVELSPAGDLPSQALSFVTGPVSGVNTGSCSPTIPWTGSSRPEEPFLLVSPPPESGTPVPFAVDMTGRLVWYDDGPDREGEVALVTTITDDGTILELVSSDGVHDQILREIDPAGHPVRQTSVSRINRQLGDLGAPDTITAFFHEAIRFPDGKTLAGCSTERMLDGVQGIPAGFPEDVLGNLIVSLDEDWQVVWYWDAFVELDLDRRAILDEHCIDQTPGCPPLTLAVVARDWTHGNCIVPAWDTGDLLYSLRHQDWIVTIDYDNGAGNGSVREILGRDGDLPLSSGDPTGWFSHQHGIAPLASRGEFLLFDNGNTRCDAAGPDCHSRAQRWEMGNGTIRLLENIDLGDYSSARGMSQRLSAGDTHYVLGTLGTPNAPLSRSVELDGSGRETFALECTTWAYRTYRIRSLEAPR